VTTKINPTSPSFLKVGNRYINVASIAFIEDVNHLGGTDVYIHLNASKPDGKLQSIKLRTVQERKQIRAFLADYAL
jgi:hypothetical protein